MICPHCGNDTQKWEIFNVIVTRDLHGRTSTWIEVRRDQDGIMVGRRFDTYSYHRDGSLSLINMKVYEGSKSFERLISDRDIKY